MKIQILGDSFGLPRLNKGTKSIEIAFENTYPEQLRKTLCLFYPDEDIIVINSSKRYNNSSFLVKKELKETILIQPDYIIIQVGIVDCWGRDPETYIFEEFIGKDPWVSKDEYYSNLDHFILSSKNNILGLKAIILVNITKSSEEQYSRNLTSSENTIKYNKILTKLGNKHKDIFIVDMYEVFSKKLGRSLCSDGVHPSEYGNSLISNYIFEEIYINDIKRKQRIN